MTFFPRNYKNCMRYMNENYKNYTKKWHINWKQDNAVYLLKDFNINQDTINIWINAWLLIKDSTNIKILESCLAIVKDEELRSQFIERWLTLYNYALYPELVIKQQSIYRDGEIFFSNENYCNKTLSAIEQSLRQSFEGYRVYIDLNYVTQFDGSILGLAKLNQPLKLKQSIFNSIQGKILFKMLTQEPLEKQRILYNKVKGLLAALSASLQLVFNELILIIDNGFETFTLNERLNKKSLSGNLYKVIKNEED